MAIINIKLKQHTPMWHFQWDQPGCALRVTELKPKLDKFLIRKLGGRSEVPDNYWVDSQKKSDENFYALNYKVHLTPLGEPSDFSNAKFNLFFANMGENGKPKFPIYYKDGINCRFFSLNEDLIEFIKEHLNEFFASTNFGTRQSKGFGSFLPEGLHDLEKFGAAYKFVIDVPQEITEKNNQKRYIQPLSTDYFQELFKKLDVFYKALRSGDTRKNNKGDIKQKSMLEKYVSKKFNETWDKDTFQELLFASVPEERFLYRDLLGFSPTIEYRLGHLEGCKIEKTSQEVERFKSPIMFKIVQLNKNNKYQFDIYLYLSEIPKEMREALFTARSSSPTGHTKEMTLDPKLSLQEYMDFVYKNKEQVGGSARYIFKTLQKL